MTLKNRIFAAGSYRGSNFFDAKSIGVIGRGPSNLRLDLCCNQFNHCILAGEFDKTLDYIERYLSGKHIVLSIMQYNRYRTSMENCNRLGIKNIQIQKQENTKSFRKVKNKYPDLKVVGYTKRHYELSKEIFTFGSKNIYTTGIAGVFHALYFNPDRLYIIGLDFYDESQKQYAVGEKHDVISRTSQGNCIKTYREGMIANLRSMQRCFPKTEFHLFTTFRGISSYKNLLVHYVKTE